MAVPGAGPSPPSLPRSVPPSLRPPARAARPAPPPAAPRAAPRAAPGREGAAAPARRVTFPAAGSPEPPPSRRHPPLRAVPAPGERVPRGMSCASGSVVLPAGEPPRAAAAPLELPAGAGEASGDTPEEGEGRRGGSESGAAGGDKPETRSVCSSSESGSGGHGGGAGPICKICFQGPEQVSTGAGGGRAAPAHLRTLGSGSSPVPGADLGGAPRLESPSPAAAVRGGCGKSLGRT